MYSNIQVFDRYVHEDGDVTLSYYIYDTAHITATISIFLSVESWRSIDSSYAPDSPPATLAVIKHYQHKNAPRVAKNLALHYLDPSCGPKPQLIAKVIDRDKRWLNKYFAHEQYVETYYDCVSRQIKKLGFIKSFHTINV